MDSKLFLTMAALAAAVVAAAAGTTSDYVRPPPRGIINLSSSSESEPPSSPRQVHISLAGANHMRISWMTRDKQSPSVVQYGTSSKNYTSTAQGESTGYNYLTYKSGKIHHTVIGPLRDGTLYFYRCGGGGPEFQLRTPPSKFPVTFAVAGDLGQTGWTRSTLGHIAGSKHDLLLLPGDLSYADYMQPLWDSFGELVQPLASMRPWMVTQGNHDKEEVPLLKHSFLSYNSRWKMPYKESNSNSNLYYSFDSAGVHVIMLGSYTDYDVQSDQYNWLKADLSQVNRGRTPWILVLLHVPWYNSNEAHQGEGDRMMAAMEPLLHAAAVDVVFSGHVHAYERSKGVFNGKSDPCGSVHITIGDGGNREGLARWYKGNQPEWSVFREASFGHGELNVVNSTHAFWSWHRNNDDEPVMSDQVWIKSLVSSGCLAKKNNVVRKLLKET
ncbi:purple acid phosphatase 18 [Perilla frutescens var. hirtella]|uniref:Purple acid phosphatase n=1 Tax=Perilla frutescens var. hirtella TaxID=608512 RepID=A0AAD4P0U8_PERFH|nr:purple acid phosphatase 18 [Perilla frutescens var. hirtella]